LINKNLLSSSLFPVAKPIITPCNQSFFSQKQQTAALKNVVLTNSLFSRDDSQLGTHQFQQHLPPDAPYAQAGNKH
jgi:hypothetical protein